MLAFLGKAAGNGTKAALLAGYSKSNAPPQASRLLRKANVKAALEQAAAKLARPTIMDLVERRELFTQFARTTRYHPLTRIKAMAELNKMDGVYVQKHKHLVGVVDVAGLVEASWQVNPDA